MITDMGNAEMIATADKETGGFSRTRTPEREDAPTTQNQLREDTLKWLAESAQSRIKEAWSRK